MVLAGLPLLHISCLSSFALGLANAIEEPHPAYLSNDFIDGGIPPASFIFSSDHLWPPYDLSADAMEPAKRCDALQAHLCGIQKSIRLVTQARLSTCPELLAGGSRRLEALQNVSAGYYSSLDTTSTGFDIFVFDADGVTLADGLRPELVGKRIDGRDVSGSILQPQLLPYVQWVVDWNGGFVPHISKRLDGESIAVVSYVEACPGTGDYIGVSLARRNTRISTSCTSQSDQLCAQHNSAAFQGLGMLDLLTARNAEEFSSVLYDISYGDGFTVSDFRIVVFEMSWYGYPGDDANRNPAPLSDTYETFLANGYGPTMGLNGTDMFGFSSVTMSVSRYAGSGAWNGGGWVYIGDPIQEVMMVAGVTWNRTLGLVVMGGFSHNPRAVVGGPLCTECLANYSLACSLANAESLNSHARVDMLIPEHSWDRLTYLRWFGAAEDSIDTLQAVGDQTWPAGFYVAAFNYEGVCVAHAGNDSFVGKTCQEIFGNADAHTSFLSVTTDGERWVPFVDNGVQKLAHVQTLAKDGGNFYVVTAIGRAWAPFRDLGSCSASNLEKCSIWNAQALLGGAAGDILASYHEDEVVEVVRQMEAMEGPFASEFVGDFQAHLYNENFECWSAAEAAGVACPPAIPSSQAAHIRSAVGMSADVVGVPVSWGSTTMVAFTFRLRWLPLGGFTVQDLYIVVFVAKEATTPKCVEDSDCPDHSACSAAGRCLCASSSYVANTSFVLDECGHDLIPTEMNCVEVENMDCTNTAGDINLAACRPCPEGHFCSHGYKTLCPRGQYCPTESGAPKPCSKGSAANVTGSATCTLCEVGTSTSWAASYTCTPCVAGTYAGTTGQSLCKACAQDSYSSAGQASCTPCPGGTYASRVGAESVAQCRHCAKNYYFQAGECRKCAWGLHAPASDATSCSLAPSAQIALICAACTTMLAATLLVVSNRKYRQKVAALKQKAGIANAELLRQAKECANEISCPLAVMNLDTQFNLTEDQLPMSHQGHRDQYRLFFLDSFGSVKDFQGAGHHLIYVSYERGVCNLEGLSPAFHSALCLALREVLASMGWEAGKTYIWIDRLSVPQDHTLLRSLATDSLYMYSKCAELLLVVAGGPTGCLDSSISDEIPREAQCRAEVLAHCCSHGPQDVFIFDTAGLRMPPLDWLLAMACVFEGDLPSRPGGSVSWTLTGSSTVASGSYTVDSLSTAATSNAEGRPDWPGRCGYTALLLPMLALFYDGIRADADVTSAVLARDPATSASSPRYFFQNQIFPNKDRIFPAFLQLRHSRRDGKMCLEDRELFGELIELATREAAGAGLLNHPNSEATEVVDMIGAMRITQAL